ncbi:MAG: hypothetical protein EOO56_19285 [Hymenobacter sp.]|nr:MAG: hypothetical protein EOO56_19285 [Hymenobacter sp.]
MASILIEPLSEQAYELLRQVEVLNILRVVTTQELPPAPIPAKPSVATLISSLSAETGERMLHEIAKMRNEWEWEY